MSPPSLLILYGGREPKGVASTDIFRCLLFIICIVSNLAFVLVLISSLKYLDGKTFERLTLENIALLSIPVSGYVFNFIKLPLVKKLSNGEYDKTIENRGY